MTTPHDKSWSTEPTTSTADPEHGRPPTSGPPHPSATPDGGHGLDRRAFLRLAGFSFAGAGLAGCGRGPVRTALSQLVAQPDVLPGKAYWIASTSWADGAGNGLLVKCRDGRPIKLEGNPEHPLNRGGLTAACQASLLSLYDDQRLAGPLLDGAAADWAAVDERLSTLLAAARTGRGRVRLLTPTLTSPSTRAAIERLMASLPDARHVTYDSLSCSALLDAQAEAWGARVLPRYDLSAARSLAVCDADPLGTGISRAEYAAGCRHARRTDTRPAQVCRHWQFEARLSLTGCRSDHRSRTAPWELPLALAWLASDLAGRGGVPLPGPAPAPGALRPALRTALERLATDLWDQRPASLVLCGRNDLDCQRLTTWINQLLDNQGTTVHLSSPSLQRAGDDRAVQDLRDELLAGQVDLLITTGNPAYELPGFAVALQAAGTLVSCSDHLDETASLAAVVCPEPHELERWDDSEPQVGLFATTQPTLPALRSCRSLRASLARWSGDQRDDDELLRDHWRRHLAPRREQADAPFGVWFAEVLERGWVRLPSDRAPHLASFDGAALSGCLQRAGRQSPPSAGSFGLVLHHEVGVLDGRGAHNPWLQELPDPVTKVVWDNHADLSPASAERLGLSQGDVVRLVVDDQTLELPVLIQPGQDDRVVVVALGYGRLGTDRFTNIGPEWIESHPTVAQGDTVGVDASPLLLLRDGVLASDVRQATLEATGRTQPLACTQDHHSLSLPAHLAPTGHEVRDAVRQLAPGESLQHAEHAGHAELWSQDHRRDDSHHWGLVVDLAACTGCSACVVSCQAENNVPVVGRDEVRRHREMSWLRIDRYYAEHEDGDVGVVHQPMMCQHCDHAPCETVCPVLATVHDSGGLNAQVYNRCVGTRYCANNCPYKVRRFNWFEYAQDDRLQNMALNPDVTIRSRGVMEKCSMCVQRIQAGKAQARREGRPLADGDVQTACQQSCPSSAIVFGDLADPESRIAGIVSGQRSYTVLEELNVQPSVTYLADVRHPHGPASGGAER